MGSLKVKTISFKPNGDKPGENSGFDPLYGGEGENIIPFPRDRITPWWKDEDEAKLSIDPEDGATHQKFTSKQITIEFSAALDSDTVTDESVTVLAYPISGIIETAEDEVNLFKKLTVSGKKLIIDL